MAVVIQLQRVLQLIEAKHMEAMEDLGVTPRQVLLLRAIAEAKATPNQTMAVAATGMDRSTLADVVKRLVKKGLIKRNRNKDDARAYDLHLTEAGRATLKGALKAMKSVEKTGAGVPNFAGLAAAVDACLGQQPAVAAE